MEILRLKTLDYNKNTFVITVSADEWTDILLFDTIVANTDQSTFRFNTETGEITILKSGWYQLSGMIYLHKNIDPCWITIALFSRVFVCDTTDEETGECLEGHNEDSYLNILSTIFADTDIGSNHYDGTGENLTMFNLTTLTNHYAAGQVLLLKVFPKSFSGTLTTTESSQHKPTVTIEEKEYHFGEENHLTILKLM